MQLASVPRKPLGHHNRFVMAAQAAPLPRGLPLWCHGFCLPRKLCNEKINTTHHHECKNAHHRDAAPTALTAKRWH